jgi:pleuromutilin/lincosamide/streptogramin A transport system ATP-binding/permease protein
VDKEAFFMIILEANHIKKMMGERLLFSVQQLRIHERDRIGVVGKNGAGKTQ